MDDIFSKIVAILLVVIIFFISPIYFYKQRQNNLRQTYVLTNTVALIDDVRNTGVLSDNRYREYCNYLYSVGSNYEIKISAYDKEGNLHKSSKDIIDNLSTDGKCEFNQYEYIRIQVKETNELICFYGGSIKA